jgi:flagellar hook-associated protein 3 FlgL
MKSLWIPQTTRSFFEEDPGEGENAKDILEGTIPDGTYSPEDLAVAVKNVMNKASEDDGYGITYEVSYDSDDGTFTIMNDGAYEGYMKVNMLWESGEEARVTNVNTEGILEEGVDIEVLDGDALTIDTPEPEGTAPIRLTWDDEDSVWKVLNDPGYDLELEIEGTDSQVELDLTGDGVTDIMVTMESPAEDGGYVEFDIISASEEHSIGPDMGFNSGDVSYTPPTSSSAVTLKSFDNTNRVIDFAEDIGGGASSQLTAVIPEGDYTDMDDVASAIETAMETASYNDINYEVTYDDDTNKFTIEEDGNELVDLDLLWNTGTNAANSAATELGFDNAADDTGLIHTSDNRVALFTIGTGTNDAINFKEILPGSSQDETVELTAVIAPGDYYDPESLARAVEDALEDASAENGNRVDYDVSYSYNNQTFSIEEDGTLGRQLDDLAILWGTGDDTQTSAAETLGFDDEDVTATPMEGDPVGWGIFETLFDLKDYLAADDVDGIQRTITRLDTHYDSITSVISDIGMKYDRLSSIQQVSQETTLSLTERKSMIEDADFAESVLELNSIQTAYEASLSSTAKIINISLIDFM